MPSVPDAGAATALEMAAPPPLSSGSIRTKPSLRWLAPTSSTPTATAGRFVAYPFSGRERGHSVLIAEIHEVEAMCAIDALRIAPMLGLPIEVRSPDPISGDEIHVQLQPGGRPGWQPAAEAGRLAVGDVLKDD